MRRIYGWRPDKPDFRDYKYKAKPAVLPPAIDLRPKCSPVLDQGQLGSCTANAWAAAFQFDSQATGKPVFPPSRLFIYYNERVLEGTVNTDSGAEIRDGAKTLAGQGVCSETAWPYVIAQFKKKPTKACYADGLKHQAVSYYAVAQSLATMKGCLAEGFPFVLGFSVYESFESDQVAATGVVPLPQKSERLLGGHAVLAVGYDDASQRFLVQNSWGTGWGLAGFFTIPYAYLTNAKLASDFWTLRTVE